MGPFSFLRVFGISFFVLGVLLLSNSFASITGYAIVNSASVTTSSISGSILLLIGSLLLAVTSRFFN